MRKEANRSARRARRVRVAVVVVSGALAAGLPLAMGPAPASAGVAYDGGLLSSITRITGAQSMWNRGFVGQGVDVAVIDTGVARVEGLDRPGQVIDGPDLSFDSQEPGLEHVDAFGHGTHMAGIIAGSDVAPGSSAVGCTTCTGASAYTDSTKFVGVAPEARIVNVKVGAFDGAVDVSQVIAGIDWVVQHRNDPGMNIRVLNLSFGTDSVQPAAIDPLVHAVEAAWDAGIVVVAAAGNEGKEYGPMADPAISPAVIAVGSTDPLTTLEIKDDKIAKFAQHGTAERMVDVVAPGVSVRSLRVIGSFVDDNITTGKEGRFQRASGTSQSAAIVSGLAALLLSQYPQATPDMIKQFLKTNAVPFKPGNDKTWYAGSGTAYLAKVTGATVMPEVAAAITTGDGSGTLEGSRGTYYVTSGGVPLTGEQDIFGRPWDSLAMSALTESATAWTGGTWNGSQWTSDDWTTIDSESEWTSVKWAGARWTSVKWASVKWANSDWTGARWTDAVWDGARWSGARWSDVTWDGARWSGARWTGARWTSGSWAGARWSGARWSDAGWF